MERKLMSSSWLDGKEMMKKEERDRQEMGEGGKKPVLGNVLGIQPWKAKDHLCIR